MPRFVIERNVGTIDPKGLEAAAKKSVEMMKKGHIPGVKWIRSYVSEAEGKIYCEYEAPSLDVLNVFNAEHGALVSKISPVASEINPDMFQ